MSVVETLATQEADPTALTIDRDGSGIEMKLDLLVAVESGGPQPDALEIGVPLEPALRERGALIRKDGLGADERDGLRPAELTQERASGAPGWPAPIRPPDPY